MTQATMTALPIDLSPLREQTLCEIERSLKPVQVQDLVADSATLTQALTLRLTLVRHDTGISFEGSLSGEWELACARCLAPARLRFNASLDGEAPMSAESFDASEEARQALLLALPLNPLCRPECQGLCPICGVSRNDVKCDCTPAPDRARR